MFPNEEMFTEAFGVEALVKRPEDGYWLYSFKDASETTLNLSVNEIEQSFQIALVRGGTELWILSHEGEVHFSVWTEGSICGLRAKWQNLNEKTTVLIKISPSIRVHWATLRQKS